MWEDASDNIGLKNYVIRRNGAVIASLDANTNRFTDENLTGFTDYSYTITTIDLADNTSPESAFLTVRTLGKPGTGTNSSGNSSISANSSGAHSSTANSSTSSGSMQTIQIVWSHPAKRENGSFLELDEIGGYEIRYRKPGDKYFTYFSVPGNRTTTFSYTGDFKDAEFEIAVFDSKGLYSRFSPVTK